MKTSYGETSGFALVSGEELALVNGGKGSTGGGSTGSGSVSKGTSNISLNTTTVGPVSIPTGVTLTSGNLSVEFTPQLNPVGLGIIGTWKIP